MPSDPELQIPRVIFAGMARSYRSSPLHASTLVGAGHARECENRSQCGYPEWGSNLFTTAGSPLTTILQKENTMSIDRVVMAFAGAMILISLLLSWMYSHYWLLLTAFVGANLFQAAFTGFCPLAILLKKIGMKPGMAFK
jgi:hypothetical protein